MQASNSKQLKVFGRYDNRTLLNVGINELHSQMECLSFKTVVIADLLDPIQ
jgi:hypothetical protein